MKTTAWVVLTLMATQAGSVHDVMEAANEGKNSLYDRVSGGKGTPEEARKLSNLYQALPGLKPPKGDAKSWKEKATALATAAKEVADRKPGAMEKLKAAANCKACHGIHKPD
jgi:cytochrome c553